MLIASQIVAIKSVVQNKKKYSGHILKSKLKFTKLLEIKQVRQLKNNKSFNFLIYIASDLEKQIKLD